MNRREILVLSDLLVLVACQRAYARVRSALKAIPPTERHRGYEFVTIPEPKIDAALANAWALCPMLASRHRLGIDPAAWTDALDGYTRALLLMGEPHTLDRLGRALSVALPGDDVEPAPDTSWVTFERLPRFAGG